MPTIRVIRVDYEDQSRYHTDFQDFKDFINFILSHRNYDFHIRALNAESEAAFGCLRKSLCRRSTNKEVHDV